MHHLKRLKCRLYEIIEQLSIQLAMLFDKVNQTVNEGE